MLTWFPSNSDDSLFHSSLHAVVDIGFTQSTYTVAEDAGFVTVCLRLDFALSPIYRSIDIIVYTAPYMECKQLTTIAGNTCIVLAS